MRTSVLYRRCQQVIEAMLEDGYATAERVRWCDIEPYVAMLCGADPRTLQKYRHYFVYFGFFTKERPTIYAWCERDKFNNPVKQKQATFSLLRVLNQKSVPKRNY